MIELNYDDVRISRIYAFGQRSMFLTEDFRLFVGDIDFDMTPLDKFRCIESLTFNPRTICLGQEHCLILDGTFILTPR
jgi:hypothetical protein